MASPPPPDWNQIEGWLAEIAILRESVGNLQGAPFAYEAVESVERAARDGDVKAALATLKGLGLLPGRCGPVGPEEPETLREEAEIGEKRAARDRLMCRLIAG